MNDNSWKAIFDKNNIHNHNFRRGPFLISAEQIKQATAHFKKTNEKEVRILCKQDSREDRPEVFIDNGLFLLPTKNGSFAIVKGEGYIDIPEVDTTAKIYSSKLDFRLDTSLVGNSEMQHLDFAYASSLVRTFLEDDTLVLTISGRKEPVAKTNDKFVSSNSRNFPTYRDSLQTHQKFYSVLTYWSN